MVQHFAAHTDDQVAPPDLVPLTALAAAPRHPAGSHGTLRRARRALAVAVGAGLTLAAVVVASIPSRAGEPPRTPLAAVAPATKPAAISTSSGPQVPSRPPDGEGEPRATAQEASRLRRSRRGPARAHHRHHAERRARPTASLAPSPAYKAVPSSKAAVVDVQPVTTPEPARTAAATASAASSCEFEPTCGAP